MMTRPHGLLCGLLSAALCLSTPLAAQVVRGTVVDATDRAVSGVVVALVDSTQTVVARGLTNDRGEYRVAAQRAGRYRFRTLRIGFQPTESRSITLEAGTIAVERLVLDGVRVSLEAVRIVERSACGRQNSTETGTILSAWDQAMTSIASTALASSGRGLTATTMQIERKLDGAGRRVFDQYLSVRTDYVTQPWRSLSADTLRKRGYTITDSGDWTTYYAPGLDVLVSAQFLEDHCVKLVAAKDSAEIGLAFEPVPARRALSEIRGTLWLSRSSADLRRLEYVFTGGPTANTDYPSGGSMAFTRLPDGGVVISSWEIRMPELVKDSPRATRVRVANVLSTGGQLVVLRRANDTLYKRPALAVSGGVQDSVSGAPIPRAMVSFVGTTMNARATDDGRFVIPDVLPGEYTLSVRTPSLDSVRTSSSSMLIVTDGMAPLRLRVPTATQLASSLCGSALAGSSARSKGAILGSVSDPNDTTTLAGVRVAADWTEVMVRASSAAGVDRQSKRLETKTDASGAFRLCGVPTEATLTLRALPERGRSEVMTVRLSADERFASRTLRVDRAKGAVATFSGTVVADSTQRALADAEVSIPALSLTTRSNARGEFRLGEVPAGTHEIFVRRVGYGAITAPMTFAANDEEERRLVLRPLNVLDSVEVTADRTDIGLKSFEENRRVGLGEFLTRDDLAKNNGRKLGNIIQELNGAGVVQAANASWVLAKRHIVSLGSATGSRGGDGSTWFPSNAERMRGMRAGCYAQVWIDNQLMNPSSPTEPYDINGIAPDQIEALEWYGSPAQTPSKYSKLNSNCGVIVIHTRRFESIKK